MKKRTKKPALRAPDRSRADLVQSRLAAAAEQLKHRPALHRSLRKIFTAYRSGKAENQLAQELQARLLPAADAGPKIHGLQIATHFIKSPEGVTDMYDVFEIGEGRVGFFLAETSGKGLDSALLLTLTKVAIDSARTRLLSPGEILEQVNDEIVARTSTDQYLTAFLGLLDIRTCTMRYVNASDKCPIFSGEGGLKLLCTRNRFLGKSKGTRFPESEMSIGTNDNFLLFTSGISAAKNRSGRAYSLGRLSKLVAEEARADADVLLKRVSADLEKHIAGGRCPADISLIAVKLTNALCSEMRIVISTDPAQLSGAVTAVMERMKALNYGERSMFAMRLCLEEALINAMKHGNKMDRTRRITVTCSSDTHEAQISVEDEGPGFHPEVVPDPTRPENIQLAHGRGLLLMRSYMDKVTHNAKGNKVTLVKKAPWQ